MYQDFFGLNREPFHVTPDPYFFYLSPSHKEAFASLIYGLKKRKGFVAIIGEIGLGKTTVVRTFLQRKALQDKIKIIFVFNANVSFKGLLKIIYAELGRELPALCKDKEQGPLTPNNSHHNNITPEDETFELVQGLHQILIEEYQSGNNLVLVIDEAQNMPIKTLENLRMLSNLETAKDKLLQIFLIGQPELKQTLDRPELRQLKQRIALWVTLRYLTPKETISYINFRLKKAGLMGENPFTSKALQMICEHSQGTPRKINILCDNALITAFGAGQHKIGAKLIKEVIADLEATPIGSKRNPLWILLGFLLIFSLSLGLLLIFLNTARHPIHQVLGTDPLKDKDTINATTSMQKNAYPSIDHSQEEVASTLKPDFKRKRSGQSETLPPLDPEGAIIFNKLFTLVPVFKNLSLCRQYVLVEIAKQTSVDGLLTFERMFRALKAGNYSLAAKEMLYSHWAKRVGHPAFVLAMAMHTGLVRDFILAKRQKNAEPKIKTLKATPNSTSTLN